MTKIMSWLEFEIELTNCRYGEELLHIPNCERDFLKKYTSDKYAFGRFGIYSLESQEQNLPNMGTFWWNDICRLAMVKIDEVVWH